MKKHLEIFLKICHHYLWCEQRWSRCPSAIQKLRWLLILCSNSTVLNSRKSKSKLFQMIFASKSCQTTTYWLVQPQICKRKCWDAVIIMWSLTRKQAIELLEAQINENSIEICFKHWDCFIPQLHSYWIRKYKSWIHIYGTAQNHWERSTLTRLPCT